MASVVDVAESPKKIYLPPTAIEPGSAMFEAKALPLRYAMPLTTHFKLEVFVVPDADCMHSLGNKNSR